MVSGATGGSRLGEHAVYPGSFDPITPGHLDIIERARHLFARITVLVAVNDDKQPASTQSERVIQVRRKLPANWDNVSVAGWAGLTVAFCRQHGAGVIIRGVRNRPGLLHEYQLAAMNEALGVTTLLLPAKPGLAAMSSTVLRGLGTWGPDSTRHPVAAEQIQRDTGSQDPGSSHRNWSSSFDETGVLSQFRWPVARVPTWGWPDSGTR
jgi:pantetheine-phosphate adenylyltransferase